ncbi:MAG: hypothetical protein QW514_07685 [Thermoprotei archaeon]
MESESIRKITSFLRALLEREGYAERLVESGFKSITPEVMCMWVRERVKLLPDGVKKLYFENPLVAPLTRRVLSHHRSLIEYYLGHPENTLNKICEVNPANAEALKNLAIREYVLNELTTTYEYLKGFINGR